MPRLTNILSLLWEFPLFIFSFFFYRLTRWGFRRTLRTRIRKGKFNRKQTNWKGLSDILSKPMGLPYVMITGPRWNCHAIIGMVGPLSIKSFVQINLDSANKSATRWTLTIYNLDYQTVACLSSETCPREGWQRVQLKSGTYFLTIRYYHWRNDAEFPVVNIDGMVTIDHCPTQEECQLYPEFIERIRNYGNIFYLCLHYYVYFMLLRQKLFLSSFVNKEFLPVGNCETAFFYGIIKKGEGIQIEITQMLLSNSLIFFTFYNQCSFPVCWEEITRNIYRSQPMPCKGYYLLRVHSTIKPENEVRLHLNIAVCQGTPDSSISI